MRLMEIRERLDAIAKERAHLRTEELALVAERDAILYDGWVRRYGSPDWIELTSPDKEWSINLSRYLREYRLYHRLSDGLSVLEAEDFMPDLDDEGMAQHAVKWANDFIKRAARHVED